MGRFILKHINNKKPQIKVTEKKEEKPKEVKTNKKKINEKVMTTNEKVALAQEVLNSTQPSTTKRIKRDKGLIERTESSKTILTEDNKELLVD